MVFVNMTSQSITCFTMFVAIVAIKPRVKYDWPPRVLKCLLLVDFPCGIRDISIPSYPHPELVTSSTQSYHQGLNWKKIQFIYFKMQFLHCAQNIHDFLKHFQSWKLFHTCYSEFPENLYVWTRHAWQYHSCQCKSFHTPSIPNILYQKDQRFFSSQLISVYPILPKNQFELHSLKKGSFKNCDYQQPYY